MSHHEGVSCDSCLDNNFRGKRYKCLICFDYDLCATCHDSGTLNGRHTADHPMQCILTRSDLDFYFAGELTDQPHSFTCPFCGKLGFTDSTLYDHVSTLHTDSTTQVVCPICATSPGGEPNQITDDFLTHLSIDHQPHIVRIRSRHHPRGLNNRSRRSQFLNPGAGGSSAASTGSSTASTNSGISSVRDPSIDPITQLLSQLSDVRRVNAAAAAAAAAAGSSGMMPLQFVADPRLQGSSSSSNRLPIERIIRRHQQGQPSGSTSATQALLSSSLAAAGIHSESLAAAAAAAASSSSSSMPYMVLLDPSSSSTTNTTSPAVNNTTHSKSMTSSKKQGAKYLLSSNSISSNIGGGSTTSPADVERERQSMLRADRSIFVEEMILASLGEPLSMEAIFASSGSSIRASTSVATGAAAEEKTKSGSSSTSSSGGQHSITQEKESTGASTEVKSETSSSDVMNKSDEQKGGSSTGSKVEDFVQQPTKSPVAIEVVCSTGSTVFPAVMPQKPIAVTTTTEPDVIESEEIAASSFVPRKPSFRSSAIESSDPQAPTVPQKPLPSFASGTATSVVHRSTSRSGSGQQVKPLRPAPSGSSVSSSVASVPLVSAIRSSLNSHPRQVVSPTGGSGGNGGSGRRSKVVPPQHKHSTEPPPN